MYDGSKSIWVCLWMSSGALQNIINAWFDSSMIYMTNNFQNFKTPDIIVVRIWMPITLSKYVNIFPLMGSAILTYEIETYRFQKGWIWLNA